MLSGEKGASFLSGLREFWFWGRLRTRCFLRGRGVMERALDMGNLGPSFSPGFVTDDQHGFLN